jgi:hypothetical protein
MRRHGYQFRMWSVSGPAPLIDHTLRLDGVFQSGTRSARTSAAIFVAVLAIVIPLVLHTFASPLFRAAESEKFHIRYWP